MRLRLIASLFLIPALGVSSNPSKIDCLAFLSSQENVVNPRENLIAFAKEVGGAVVFDAKSDERVYLASTYKIFVAIAVFRAIEAGHLRLETRFEYSHDDLVDGSPVLSGVKFGTAFTVKQLLEAMLQHSDNSATEMFFSRIGVREMRKVEPSIPGVEVGELISMLEARRRLWSELDDRARLLRGSDFLQLRNEKDLERKLELFSKLTKGPKPSKFQYWEAQRRFYLKDHNKASMKDLGTVLELLAEGKIINEKVSRQILEIMKGCQTGQNRLMKFFGPGVDFAHKTGTLDPHMLHVGVVTMGERKFVVAASVRDFYSRASAEEVLATFGKELIEAVDPNSVMD